MFGKSSTSRWWHPERLVEDLPMVFGIKRFSDWKYLKSMTANINNVDIKIKIEFNVQVNYFTLSPVETCLAI